MSIYLVGAGGHASVVADILVRMGTPALALLDDRHAGAELRGIPVLTESAVSEDCTVIIAIGNNWLRERLAGKYAHFGTAIHPAAIIGEDVEIGEGTVVMAGAVINPGARVGRHCIVNTRASLDHDCVIEDFASVAPGATLGGRVRVGRGSAVAIGAVVLHGRTIGGYTVVGAGAVVTKDVPDQVVAVGMPARSLRRRERGDSYL